MNDWPINGAPHGLFATHKQELTRELLDLISQ